MADVEPGASARRPTGDMQPRDTTANHANHDLLVIAEAADRAADVTTVAAAEQQAAACGECAALLADLRSIAGGLSALPRTAAIPRDFRITPEQAQRLRREPAWRRFLRGFGTPELPSLRIVASAFTTLGLAGILITAVLPGLIPGGGSPSGILSTVGSAITAPGVVQSGKDAAGSFVPELAIPSPATGGAAPASSSTADFGGPGGTAASTPGDTAAGLSPTPESASPSPPSWTAVSAIVLGIGVALFAIRLGAQRLR